MEDKVTFVELHDYRTGDEILINPKAIECVRGNIIYFHGYSVAVEESYSEIKSIIQEVVKLG